MLIIYIILKEASAISNKIMLAQKFVKLRKIVEIAGKRLDDAKSPLC